MEATKNLAVLIDADNADAKVIDVLLTEIANYGVASVKRIYGDWTLPNLGGWKETLLEHSIQPMQQFAYTKGKNATDMAMAIDAMDLLYSGKFNGFCIISSDSDFTRLASRIRESGLTVYGFGQKKTPTAFVSSCDKFIYTEVLQKDSDENTSIKKKSPTELRKDRELMRLLQSSSDAASDDTGWGGLGPIGSNLAKKSPGFDSRNYGYSKLADLIIATELFEIEERRAGSGNGRALYVRRKTKKKS